MSYNLIQTRPDRIDVTKDLESFFLCYHFNVEAGGKTFQLQKGFFAVYLSQKSGPPFIQSLYNDNDLGKEDEERDLELSNRGGYKVAVKSTRLVNSRFAQFSNEVSQLHLFEFTDLDDQKKKESINTKEWTPQFKTPLKNDNDRYFLKHTLSFNSVKDRYVYWLSTQTNANGTERFAVAVPFIATSVIGTTVALHNEKFPKVEISVDGKSWSYPKGGEDDVEGNLKGFVIVADGAFKAMELNSNIDKLCELSGQQTNTDEVMNYLSQVVHKYPTKLCRNLNTISNTKDNSIVLSEPNLPIEILYMEGINSDNPMPLIIK